MFAGDQTDEKYFLNVFVSLSEILKFSIYLIFFSKMTFWGGEYFRNVYYFFVGRGNVIFTQVIRETASATGP